MQEATWDVPRKADMRGSEVKLPGNEGTGTVRQWHAILRHTLLESGPVGTVRAHYVVTVEAEVAAEVDVDVWTRFAASPLRAVGVSALLHSGVKQSSAINRQSLETSALVFSRRAPSVLPIRRATVDHT